MAYSIYTNEFYKVWFSKNPDQAIGLENELVLVRLRTKHPHAKITLVYSAHCLNDTAKTQLYSFCTRYNIQLFDFDTDLQRAIIESGEPLDRALYLLAQEEIDYTLQNADGNLAAASDISRLLEPVATLGIYSDFDVELDFSQFTEHTLLSESPVLLQAASKPSFTINNEFFALAKMNLDTLHPETLKKLNAIKSNIAINYINPQQALFTSLMKNHLPAWLKNPFYLFPTIRFFQDRSEATIYEFRHYVQQLTLSQILSCFPIATSTAILGTPYSDTVSETELLDIYGAQLQIAHNKKYPNDSTHGSKYSPRAMAQERLVLLKHALYNKSVTQLTGPGTLKNLIQNLHTYEYPLTPEKLQSLQAQFNNYSVQNSPLKNCVFSNNRTQALQEQDIAGKTGTELIGLYGHQAWTVIGAQKKREREHKMNQVARRIQGLWTQYRRRPVKTVCATTPSGSIKRSATVLADTKNKKFKK